MSANTKTYDVLTGIRMHRKNPGDTIELADHAARPMVAAGWIKLQGAKPQPAKTKIAKD